MKCLQLKKLLLKGSENPRIFFKTLATIIFSEKFFVQKRFTLNDFAITQASSYKTESEKVIFNQVINLIDGRIFHNQNQWKILVQEPINQLARELKRKKTKDIEDIRRKRLKALEPQQNGRT